MSKYLISCLEEDLKPIINCLCCRISFNVSVSVRCHNLAAGIVDMNVSK